jgi:DNA-binding transcriptional regulator YdaS (Cro superfamily)
MNLLTYCELNDGTALRSCPVLARLATEAKCSAETLYMLAKGHKQPGALMAVAIEQATDGDVTRYELRPDVFGASPRIEPS